MLLKSKLDCVSALPLHLAPQESKVDGGGRRRGRPGKAGKQAQAAQQAEGAQQGEGEAALPESRWGEEPAQLSSVGLEEDEATFGTRLRRVVQGLWNLQGTPRLMALCCASCPFCGASCPCAPHPSWSRPPRPAPRTGRRTLQEDAAPLPGLPL